MHLLRHFQTDYDHSFKESGHENERLCSLARLPTELILLIASFLERKSDLVLLSRVSKRMRAICTFILYRVIDLSRDYRPHNPVMLQLRRGAFQSVHLSNLVTEFRIILQAERSWSPSPDRHAIRHWDDPKRYCVCNKLDKVFGVTLRHLNNLLVLEVQCFLCRRKHTHDFLLDNLVMISKLKEFKFGCSGLNPKEASHGQSHSLLSLVPWMRSITTLGLDCDDDRVWPTEIYQRQLESAGAFPKLQTLHHNGRGFSNALLAARPVERLCLRRPPQHLWGSEVSNADLHDAISSSPGRLAHLYEGYIDTFLRYGLGRDAQPYRHLQYIGTFEIRCQRIAALRQMEFLKPLHLLKFIEVTMGGDHWPFEPTADFFTGIVHRHPRLQRFLILAHIMSCWYIGEPETEESILWERNVVSDVWKRRSVVRSYHSTGFELWDM